MRNPGAGGVQIYYMNPRRPLRLKRPRHSDRILRHLFRRPEIALLKPNRLPATQINGGNHFKSHIRYITAFVELCPVPPRSTPAPTLAQRPGP